MLKYFIGASFLCTSLLSQAYLINTHGMKDRLQRKVLLYGDLHHVDDIIDFAFAKRQARLCSRKLSKLKHKKGAFVKVWYEGQNKDDTWAQMNPALKHDLLPTLHRINTKKQLGLHNIENRSFLVDCTLLGAKARSSRHIDADIRGIRNELRSLRRMGYYPEDALESLKAELERLEFVKSLPADKELIDRVTTQLNGVVNGLEATIKDYEAKGTLSKKQAQCLQTHLTHSKRRQSAVVQELAEVRQGKRKFTRRHIERLIVATFSLFDINFVLQVLSDTTTKKHILFAGCAHTSNIARILQEIGFSEFCRAGTMHEDLVRNRTDVKATLVSPIHEKDFDLIVPELPKAQSRGLKTIQVTKAV